MKEIWRPVFGRENEYEVSNLGQVRSKDRTIEQLTGKEGGTKYKIFKKGRLLRPGEQKNSGHQTVSLGRGCSRLVHHLVLEAFVGEKPANCECLHKNGNPKDNRLENLHWGTRAQNIRDNKWHGKYRKLSVEDVKSIKTELKNKRSPTKLAKQYGVHVSTIWGIHYGSIHSDVI